MTSETVGNINAISSKFEWEINNFSTRCKNVGDRLESPKFTVNRDNIQWNLRLFPNGREKQFKDHLALFLHANLEIEAVGTFIIYNNEGKMIVSNTMDKHVYGIAPHTGYGYDKIISRDFLTNSVNGILNDGKLTIVCEVTYKNQEVKDASPLLGDKYEALLNESKFSDLSLISEGKTVKVHKCILAQSSPVFAAMFDTEMKEKQENVVEIADIKYDVLKEMLRFIYAGRANDIDALAGELAVAADKYALDELKNTCEKTVIKNLSLSNIIDCVQLADKLSMDQLKKITIEFIVENASVVCDKPEFKLLSHDIVCQIFCCLAKKKK